MGEIRTPPLPRIRIHDEDRANAVDVELLWRGAKALKAVLPHSDHVFFMKRKDMGSVYRGELAGRTYIHDPGGLRRREQ